jgi:hypothetical protein|tara:strand:+ start:559 stop:822 length:264 start_codon:yes stop_codon:yes gene_type:complete
MKKKSKDTMVALFGVFLVLGLLGVMTKDEAKVGKVINSQHVTWQWSEDISLPTIEPTNETYLPALEALPELTGTVSLAAIHLPALEN